MALDGHAADPGLRQLTHMIEQAKVFHAHGIIVHPATQIKAPAAQIGAPAAARFLPGERAHIALPRAGKAKMSVGINDGLDGTFGADGANLRQIQLRRKRHARKAQRGCGQNAVQRGHAQTHIAPKRRFGQHRPQCARKSDILHHDGVRAVFRGKHRLAADARQTFIRHQRPQRHDAPAPAHAAIPQRLRQLIRLKAVHATFGICQVRADIYDVTPALHGGNDRLRAAGGRHEL